MGDFILNCVCPNIWVIVFIIAPAHPHATLVAVYPALFKVLPSPFSLCMIRQLFTSFLDIRTVPKKGFLRTVAQYAKDEKENRRLLELSSKQVRVFRFQLLTYDF